MRFHPSRRLAVLAAPALVAPALVACAELPPRRASPDVAVDGARPSRLARAVAPLAEAHPGLAGIVPLQGARDAFAARAVLAAAADRTLDVQYYIWQRDVTGTLLFDALRDAAGRGVRVRLLLDDNNTAGLDPTLAALDAHPNLEVRLFNPFPRRGLRALDYVTDFARTNRRMHNKSFTADGRVTIVGGRNVGDEYFGAGDGVAFADLDVLAVGDVVGEVAAAFARYWDAPSAYPLAQLVAPPSPGDADAARRESASLRASPEAAGYRRALRETGIVRGLLDGTLAVEWAPARTFVDDPAKVRAEPARTELLLLPRLVAAVGDPRRRLDVVSPYFVPGEAGTAAFADLARRGVQVRVLTNALEATDVAAVHAGYLRRREALLAAGVRLYELRRAAGAPAGRGGAPHASSGASLHAKTFAVDDARVFVGSFNFDPRSAALNTELGVLVDSPALARAVRAAFDTAIPRAAYEVVRDGDGGLRWIARDDGAARALAAEPNAGLVKRIVVGFLAVLPIEWLL